MPQLEPATVVVLALLLLVWAFVTKPIGVGSVSVPPLPTKRHRWFVGVIGLVVLLSALSWALSGPISFLGSWRGSFTYTSEAQGAKPIDVRIRAGFFRLVVSWKESASTSEPEEFYAKYKEGQLIFGHPDAERTIRLQGPNTITGEVRRPNSVKLGEIILRPASGA